MESELLKAWQEGLYWIAMKYDLDPTDDKVRDLFEEIYEAGWVDCVKYGDYYEDE